VGAAVLIFGLLATGTTWYGDHHRDEVTGAFQAAATGSARASGVGAGAAVTSSCVLRAVGAGCPSSPQCYDQLSVVGEVATARTLPCDSPHTWEVFALGTVPVGLTDDYVALKTSGTVRSVCSVANLGLVDLSASAWRIEVLPPAPSAYAAGDRMFRCLAGTGINSRHAAAFAW
jgi:hypothetical protein